MAYQNLVGIAGVTYSVAYYGSYGWFAEGFPASAPANQLTESGGIFTVPAGHDAFFDWRHVIISFFDSGGTLAGTVEYPAIAIKGTFDTSALSGNATTGVRGVSTCDPCGAPESDYQGPSITARTDTYTGTNLKITIGVDSSTSSPIAGATLKFEADVTIAAPVLWTDFVGCVEL